MNVHELLTTGELEVLGRHPDASNAVFLVNVHRNGSSLHAVYKPASGERPLWDFPNATLALREVATYELARAMGFDFVPETVWREDAPLGAGSIQRWIDDASVQDVIVATHATPGWLHVLDARLEDGSAVQLLHRDAHDLLQLAFFDAVVNNGDRKAGHILRDAENRLHAVDHGVTFHSEPRLRTVLWGYAGHSIPSHLLERLQVDIYGIPRLMTALGEQELLALEQRMQSLVERPIFPAPSEAWPAIPWPIY